ncbi:T9SS type B sorting domain-containing protein [Aequorivita sinensis]|uniref:T9SS type B sorting domain-containing protein n=1 Tax=Aequorivita sinensis TaxID=1382458 RepID=UPI001124394F|nr:T9SS type B sorting domain-containing protein [Aequorivita sinensis]
MIKKNSPYLLVLIISFLFSGLSAFAQGSTCATIEPFCAGDQALIFPNCNDQDPNCNPTAEAGPDYGCLFTQPYPAWFYLQVDQAGRLDFEIVQNTAFDANGDPIGQGLDVDFIAWGPFQQGDDLCDYTQLQAFNEIACSYSAQPIENFTIANAQPGEIYVLVITNYNRNPGFIKLEQTNAGNPNSGSTDCSIVTTQTGCVGDEFVIDAEIQGANNYLWEYDDGTGFVTIFNGDFPTITVTDGGDYRVTISFPLGTDQIKEFEIITNPQPIIANPPLDLSICDNGSTPGIFDLTQNNNVVLGAQNPNFLITYHLNLLQAESGLNPINPANAYPIVGTNQTIWVRIENEEGNCYAIDTFELTYEGATATAPTSPHYLCDQDEDGQEVINLEAVFSATILDGQNPLNYTVTYHRTQGEANAGTNSLPQPYTVAASPTTIYARVQNNNDNTCFETTQFDIILDGPPTVNSTPDALIACDPGNDGFTLFTLHDADDDITGGDPALTVTYHYTYLDAQTNEGELMDPYENRNPYNDRVYARVISGNTSCYNIVELPLEVRDSPILTVPTPYRICDDDQDGYAVFDLTSKASEILGSLDPTQYDLYYYVNEQQAIDAGEVALTAPNYSQAIATPGAFTNQTINTQTIYVLGVGNATNTTPNNGSFGCYDIVELQLFVDPEPIAIEPQDYHLCDDTVNGSTPTDQLSTFDLTSRNFEITGGNTNVTVTWYETAADELADNPIANPQAYQNRAIPPAPSNPQTLIARVSNGFGCKKLVTLTLVVDQLPTPVAPTPLEVCDDNNDGFAEFDLTLKDDEIIGGEPGVIVKYYPLEALAQAGGAGEITGPYLNNVPYTDTVWARVENISSGCFAVVELTLIVNPLPNQPTSEFGDLFACDEDGSGEAVFDLTINTPFVYGTQSTTDFTISYHTLLQEAIDGQNPILTPNAFTSSGQTIWVRLENNITLCARISEFDVILGEFPIIQDPDAMELCDDLESGSDTDRISTFNLTTNNAFITNGDATLTVKYFETLVDLQNDNPIPNPTTYTNPVDGGGFGITPYTIYVAVEGQTGCVATTELLLKVLPVPTVVEPTPLEVCDVDHDGFAEFDLTLKSDEIAGGDPSIVVTYHETLIDANNGTFPLASPFQNIVAFNQTIYARASFDLPPNTSGCFKVVPLDLIVKPSPIVPLDLPDLIACDPDGNGFAEFDLTVQEPLIYGSQDPTQLELSYHTTLEDAQSGLNPIGVPETYTNVTNPQDIFVRLAYIDGSDCYTVGKFTLIVSRAVSIVDPTPFELCEDLGPINDGFTTFDLTLKNSEITNGAPGMGVSYFLNENDAQNNINKIDPDTAFVNTVNPQTLYVRVEDGSTGCVAFTTLLLRVLPNPDLVEPQPIRLCDENIVVGPGPDDEVEIFDLTIREEVILNGGAWDVTYYESYDNAFNGIDQIPNPESYQNISNPQTIYVKGSNPDSSCFEIVKLELIVDPVPDDSAIVSPYIICEINTDGVAEFDLTTKIPEILGEQSAFNLMVSFYLDATDAANGINQIINTTAHQNRDLAGNPESPQTIYTRIENSLTGCFIGGNQSFELIVQEGAIANTPNPLIVCDNFEANDGIAEFDLEDLTNPDVVTLRNQILVGQDPNIYLISYFETYENALNNINAISFPYYNVINPQVIYARVTNSENQYDPKCFEVVEVILKVQELPKVNLEDEYRLCVDENGNPIENEDGQTSPPLIDTGLNPNNYTFQWMLNGVMIPGETGASIIALEAGEYSVIITEIASGCEITAVTTVVLSSPPLVYSAEVITSAFANPHAIEVSAQGLGEYVYQLDNGPFQTNNVFEGVSPGIHTVTIRDVNGCGSVTIEVGVVDYPLYFTPNEDGYHDTWNIIGIGTADPTAKIFIFDRYGKLLKQLSPIGEGWDGTFNGKPMPSSDYWFRVEYKEDDMPKVFTGHFTLKR